jgi:hypothetical protein
MAAALRPRSLGDGRGRLRPLERLLRARQPSIVHGAEATSVVGELYYFGGVDCPVGLVRVRAWFYDEGGPVVGGTAWESVQSTGEGAEVSGREPLPFEARGRASEAPAAASLRFTAVECL